MTSPLIGRWFGEAFAQLHPLLQTLHREGGVLQGNAELQFGTGVAGWLGRRIARNMGLPQAAGSVPLEVTISHTQDELVWARRFGTHAPMVSRFAPVGHWPDGHFRERTGTLQFELAVDIGDGGWTWRPLRAQVHGIPVPLRLLPRSHAYKRIEHGAYRFDVAVVAPGLGLLVRYAGLLTAGPAPVAAAQETIVDTAGGSG